MAWNTRQPLNGGDCFICAEKPMRYCLVIKSKWQRKMYSVIPFK